MWSQTTTETHILCVEMMLPFLVRDFYYSCIVASLFMDVANVVITCCSDPDERIIRRGISACTVCTATYIILRFWRSGTVDTPYWKTSRLSRGV